MAKKNSIREQLGISQELLASYLGITRTLLGMYETKERSLPTDALLKNATLVLAIEKSATTASPKLVQYNNKQQAVYEKELQQKIVECNYALQVAKRKLSKLQMQYQQAVTALNTTHYLLNNLSNDATNKRTKNCLEIIEAESLQKLKTCNEFAQQKLQWQIALLQQEMDVMNAGK